MPLPRLALPFIYAAVMLLLPTLYLLHRSHGQDVGDTLDMLGSLRDSSAFGSLRHPSQLADLAGSPMHGLEAQHASVKGPVIMPKLGNATVKAELGRAAWKVLHTMGQRFPDKPTTDEKEAFKAFLWLFSRLYPCGECAQHFHELLVQYPPQTASKSVVSIYLCSMHNKVNESLDKPLFDCSKLEGLYDCGCGDDKHERESEAKDAVTGAPLVHG
ncbi:uncharacterized protein L969DRAFT_89787 [Mixia osmundae IAM 14324]|uniref:Sulfhydryl oxidase n=1 Tax=Mixia osmundae (strain CBS 9802 / IAM 14324 / JCM 22182 / KY 12970) TaxID=764103 RepID=G7DV18_MIXOS|nr:uncharacterized protein L969DRAFT_89787 [Mixia osmundae IAM 14324]KEI37239.1 hypothetical protein L969DRAFT_89787 [Mixia osmundae IAM 14324]GAA94428.1 hypothetical protein E5Q_01080 [Mixia osmundae IAM 14324]